MNHRYKMTTLCYIEKDDCFLMLYRNRKKTDENGGKWVGIGGKLEDGESPDECMLREVYEETGLILTDYRFLGIITFVSDVYENEYMMLYSADAFAGEVRQDCPEGELRWIPKKEILDLPMWEGDPYFLRELLKGAEKISMKLIYQGEKLADVVTGRDLLGKHMEERSAEKRKMPDCAALV